MNQKELLSVIAGGENQQIEFKTTFNQDTILTLSAFANSKGGKVIVGVNDVHQIIGVKLTKESIQKWINEIKLKTEPSIIADATSLIVENKTVAIFSIHEFPIKPIAYRGRYYIRKQNSNHKLNIQQINEIYLKSTQNSWDSYPYLGSNYTDLDEQLIKQFITKVNSSNRFNLQGTPKECLNKLHFIKNDSPTHAAMILFSKQDLFNNVHVGRFKTNSLIIDDKMIRGNLFSVVESTMQYIIAQIKVAFEITGETTQRTEIFEYPLTALRELVVNAIVHRDYTQSTDIQIKIFDNKIASRHLNIINETIRNDRFLPFL